jgi:hypothetical protein
MKKISLKSIEKYIKKCIQTLISLKVINHNIKNQKRLKRNKDKIKIKQLKRILSTDNIM